MSERRSGADALPNLQRVIVAVIPAYEEESTIARTVRSTARYVDKVFVVDDASRDSTGRRANDAGAEVLTHSTNRGITAALQTGYDAAVAERPDFIVQLDADGQHNPDLLPSLLEAMDHETDVVLGSRFLWNDFQGYSRIRKWGIRFFGFLVSVLGGARVYDVTSGFRVYRASALARIPRLPGRHWAVEQTLMALRLRLRLKEVGVPIPPRHQGVSQFRPDVALLYLPRMLMALLRAVKATPRQSSASRTLELERSFP